VDIGQSPLTYLLLLLLLLRDAWYDVMAVGRCYFYLRLNDKPCLWVKGAFEDHRRRVYNSNIIQKIAEKLVSSILFISSQTSHMFSSILVPNNIINESHFLAVEYNMKIVIHHIIMVEKHTVTIQQRNCKKTNTCI